jgi:antitoxin component YwqK of YwqJK toxin-antitoxin module
MKTLFILFLTCLSHFVFAQLEKKFYDYKWEPCQPEKARYVSIVSKTDSGYQRQHYYLHEKSLQFTGLFDDADCSFPNGQFLWFHSNKKVKTIGQYVNGKKEGAWVSYHDNSMMADSTFYKDNVETGIQMSWYSNGFTKDSLQILDDGSAVQVGWFDNGHISHAGYFDPEGKKKGIWKYFHHNGGLSCKEIWKDGLVVDSQYFREDGEAQLEGFVFNRPAIYPGGEKEWNKYVNKKCYFPIQYKIANADSAIVVVEYAINEEGVAEDIRVVSPFYPDFDKVAVDAIKGAKKWQPAIDHNRRVKFYQRFSLVFTQQE